MTSLARIAIVVMLALAPGAVLAEDAQAPRAADPLVVARAALLVEQMKTLQRDIATARARLTTLNEQLTEDVREAAEAAGLDPAGWQLNIERGRWVPAARPEPSPRLPGNPKRPTTEDSVP